MNIYSKFLFLSSMIINLLSAEIFEINRFEEVNQHIDENTLIILDIDDTLLIPQQMLGCDEWFMNRLKEYDGLGLTFAEALDKTLFEWEGIRSLTHMNLVEDETASIIKDLQRKNIPIICLTTQRFALGPRTVYQLNLHNIDATKTSPFKDNFFFMSQNLGILFYEGILFTNGTHKGKTFFSFCEKQNIHPKKVVFINDKKSHLVELEQTCQEFGVEYVGLRYAYSDKKKSEFSYDLAKIQAKQISLDKIISDNDAKEKN